MMSPNPANRLLIVDGHSYAYRAFHAIRILSSPTGAPTNAIYGFINMTRKMLTQLNPSHLAVVWDGGLCAERMADHPEYKTHRPPMPDHLETQIDEIETWLPAAGFTSLCEDGVEADDWIASIADHAAGEMPVVIASSDKDFMQLVSDRIGLLNPNDKAEKVWTVEDVRARTGIAPEQVVDWLALIGDSVDNIPGVPGIGPKTATDLLRQFGSVNALYERIPEVKSEKLRASLAAAIEIVRRNQRLISLRDHQPAVPLDSLLIRPPDAERLRSLYSEWGFRTLLAQLEQAAPAQSTLL
jgi:DNA polymerase-1